MVSSKDDISGSGECSSGGSRASSSRAGPPTSATCPERLAADQPERAERTHLGEQGELVGAEAAAARQIRGVGKRPPRPLGLDRLAGLLAQAVDVAQADPEAAVLPAAAPAGVVDVRRVDLDAVPLGVLDQGRRVVEAHRPGVEQAGVEGRRVVALEVGRGVDDEREAGRVGLGKP